MYIIMQYGCSPVFYAAKKGHVDILKLLIEKGGDVTVGNNVRNTLKNK